MAMGFIVILFRFHFGQQTVDQLGEVGGGIVGSLLHLIVRELLLHACRHIGDAADGADAHAHVLGGDRLDTVLMPTVSAPMLRKFLISVGVSYCGPVTWIITPLWVVMFSFLAMDSTIEIMSSS